MLPAIIHIPCCFVIFNILVANCFNIDTKDPIWFGSNATEKDYFGYSVGLLRNREGVHALITAPRANSSILGNQLHQPGVLLKCKISYISRTQKCTEVLLDKYANTLTRGGENFTYMDKKDDMFLGVSLDIQQNSPNNRVVICGHLWKNQVYTKFYLANGACYVINAELDPKSVKKLVPLVDKSKQSLISPGVYYYAFAQVGTSAAFSEDGKHLFLGAPGFYDWAGTVLTYSNPERNRNYGEPIIPVTGERLSESYIGYSVTSGKFFNDPGTYVAVGAPRDRNNSYAQVYILKAVPSQPNKFLAHMTKEGTQFGEYFGASVLGVDMNNDGLTDLLVGAPFHSLNSGGDEGKVYVYISNGVGLQKAEDLYGENIPNSRFGTCISNISDINQDGYNDIAIGAPYENGKGAVYIYHGTSTGINPKYVQRIQALELSSSLLGFGISISRGLDVDGNFYPDILIGAYDSSQAVLLRTQPVIKLSGKLDFSPQQINTNITSCNFEGNDVSCFNVTTCLHYTGKHSKHTLTLETELYIDHGRRNSKERSYLIFETNPTSVIKRNISASIGKYYCFTDLAVMRHKPKDVITPIEFLFIYRLANNTDTKFCKNCPVLDQTTYANNITKAIYFQTGCGVDNMCLADLEVHASIVGNPMNLPLIIGKNTTLTINIDIKNKGEPAYIAELLIYLPPETSNVNQDFFCTLLSDQQKQETNATMSCELGNPLLKNKNVEIKIDISKIPSNTKSLSLLLEAKTGSIENDNSDNNIELVIPFKSLADIAITGIFERELIQYDDVKRTPLFVTHTYFIMNHGPSPIDIIDIDLYVPTSYMTGNGNSPVQFVSFTKLQSDSGEALTIPATCNDSAIEMIPAEPEVSKTRDEVFDERDLIAQKSSNRTLRRVSEEKSTSSNSDVTTQAPKYPKDYSDKKRKNYVINCETASCMVIHCMASPFLDSRKFAKLTVSLRVNVSALDDVLDPWYRIEYFTAAKIFISNDQRDIQPEPNSPDETSVKTILIHPSPMQSEEIEMWIIYLSIGIGILLLAIISIVLIQIGFFNRLQKEKMREMMTNKDNNTEWEPYLINKDAETIEEEHDT